MPTIDRTRNHSLPMNEAKLTVEKVVEDVRETYPALVSSVQWNADRTAADVKGKMFKGRFEVTSSQVKVHIDLSMLARPFMGKVETRLDAKLNEFFG